MSLKTDQIGTGLNLAINYRVVILCRWHETGTSGFLSALDAYEYVAQMPDLSRKDVLSIKIERYVAIPDITGDSE